MQNRIKHRIVLSSLLFGLFFGAGNLIFPVSIGQNSANKSMTSLFGFVISAVGLAVLAVIFTAKTKKDNLEESLYPYGKRYARLFTILLLLTIGPLFALPRTATVPYEVSIRTIFPSANHNMGLFIYSGLFFIFAAILALKPNKIKTLIGVIINPLFLAMLIMFFTVFLLKPMGTIFNIEATELYLGNPFLKGFEDGYQTMDVLAALMFGFVIISANDKHGNTKERFNDVVIASVFAGLYMFVIYSILGFMGASSVNILNVSSNGGLALGEIFVHYFGHVGLIFFGILITFACLKTAIGLVVSVSTYFSDITNISYKIMVLITSLVAFVVSNFGLESIITYAVPVLNFIYPLSLVHVFIGLFIKNWDKKSQLLKFSLLFTLIGSFLEVFKSIAPFKDMSLILFYKDKLPLASIGLSWVNIFVIGLLIGFIFESRKTTQIYS